VATKSAPEDVGMDFENSDDDASPSRRARKTDRSDPFDRDHKRPALGKIRSHVIKNNHDERMVVPGEPVDEDTPIKEGDELQAKGFWDHWLIVQVAEVLPNGRVRVWFEDSRWGKEDVFPRHKLRIPPQEPERFKPADAMRFWTDIDGNQEKARFINCREGVLRLKTDNGVKPVPLEKMSEGDQEAVRRILKE
jgi:hypothetical protein